MDYIQKQLIKFKDIMETSIRNKGIKGKTSAIRSSGLINLIHDSVKEQLIRNGVDPECIYPRFEETKPEIKISGFLKQKNQDVSVLPKNIEKKPTKIDWGPLYYENKDDVYGFEFSTNTLIINIRSQLSSLAKNADTLFERTFAEALNLHLRYPDMVLGEVYLIPCYEYDDEAAKTNDVRFKASPTNIEKYISFFTAMNNRKVESETDKDRGDYKYERVSLLVVDFKHEVPKVYETTEELIEDGLISEEFQLKYEPLNFKDFSKDILNIYRDRYEIKNIEN